MTIKAIQIPPDVSKERLVHLAEEWNESLFASLELADPFSEQELRTLVALAIERLPDDFANAVLERVAGAGTVPEDLLRRIIESGDQECVEAVCQRGDLSRELQALCLAQEEGSGLKKAE